MAFQLSPGVQVVEKDLTNIIPAVATSTGAFAGAFNWGPVMDPVLVSTENQLVARFGKPTSTNATSFFSAANFLSYSNSLYVCRVETTAMKNAVASGTAVVIKNQDHYDATYAAGEANVGPWAAKYPGTLGNSLLVSFADDSDFATWTYKDQFDTAPSTSDYAAANGATKDELHVIVIDEDGQITGVAGTVLEKYAYVSKASDARKADGTTNYYKEAINRNSKYIWWMDHPTADGTANTAAWGTTVATAAATTTTAFDTAASVDNDLTGGVDDNAAGDDDLQAGFALFADALQFDISLVVTGQVTPTTAKWVIENVAQERLDCVVFVSPTDSAGDMIVGSDIVGDTVGFRTGVSFNVDSSYAVLDSGWKYQYDRYNDVYRWIPLNADIAGLCARTDYTNDPWWSPGGLNRGQVKNVVKLSFNPNKAERDQLYKSGVNPVVTFPGQGTVLFGDKTLQSKPSAFDRINVRRLFIVLEKAIATAAKYQLFEFNDSFTRAQFVSTVEPFLRDVQGRRGVVDFRVVCDDTNNTGEVIDRNEFIADIYIKPTRSINFITLNFVAVRTGVSFSEIA